MKPAIALVLLAACGGNHERTLDAPEPTTPPDTLVPTTGDAPPGAVTIAVTFDGVPAPDTPVYFQNADSSVVLATLTDANGTAGAVMDSGGFVTVVQPQTSDGSKTDAPRELATFAGVASGDALHLDVQPKVTESLFTFTTTIDADPAPSVTGYRIATPCGSADTVIPNVASVVRLAGCPPVIDLLVESLDETAQVVHAHYHTNIAIAGAPTLALTGTYVAPVATTFSYATVPAAVSFVGVSQSLAAPSGTIFTGSTGVPRAGGIASAAIAVPVTTGTTAVTATTPFTSPDDPGEQLVIDWAPAGADYNLGLAGSLLPAFADRGSYDAGAHAIAWTEMPGVTQPDVVRAAITASRDDVPESHTWIWRVVAPRAGTRVALPVLPADGFDFNVGRGDVVSISELATAKLPAGYDASVRAHAFADVRRLLTGPSGRIVVETLGARVPE